MLCQNKFLQVVEDYIRPLTYPVAVKLIKEGEDFPVKTRFPKDVAGRWALCQGISMARRVGWKVGFRREDHSCIVAMMIFGYEEEPEAVKEGEIVYPYYTETAEAGKKTQEMTPRMPLDSVKGIVAAPLAKADFAADVVLVYGNSAQIIRLVQGALYRNGGKIDSSFTGRGACGSEIVVPYQTQECKVIIPGGGERVFAHTADDELVFAIPACKLDEVAFGVETTHKSGIARIPTPFMGMRAEPMYPEKYYEVAKQFGIED
ncbi:DUF169 domain-containing protein [Dethiobacter alkaliphilus]|uniref:DUF169 domain-containing protein n=1 Tax=Dethiobacter alkaliphilus TaxID=427926 RepID=UPI002225D00A|nr:DUF169 domain-containing protein [Dethiobacter alkaliphilus]MCW3491201.1 DUF169 domain-containing protein [Dethiobacter alkaliphilus]